MYDEPLQPKLCIHFAQCLLTVNIENAHETFSLYRFLGNIIESQPAIW